MIRDKLQLQSIAPSLQQDYVTKEEFLTIFGSDDTEQMQHGSWEDALLKNITQIAMDELQKTTSSCSEQQRDLVTDVIQREVFRDIDPGHPGSSIIQNIKVLYINALTSTTYTPQGYTVPSAVYHSLGLKGPVPPPQTIFSYNNDLFHCWPIAHPERDQIIALGFSKPFYFHGFSVVHNPGDLASAPRFVRVLDEAGEELVKGEYSGDESRQTFWLDEVHWCHHDEPDMENDYLHQHFFQGDEEEDYEALCSAETMSCAPPKQKDERKDSCKDKLPFVQKLTVHIDKNWGRKEFTCIYQIFIHGKE